jgi:hypothetical protein
MLEILFGRLSPVPSLVSESHDVLFQPFDTPLLPKLTSSYVLFPSTIYLSQASVLESDVWGAGRKRWQQEKEKSCNDRIQIRENSEAVG